ncbi:MAG TPA: M64 family metallopeptidase [Pyrinomonadaceae bacterium]|nr:M64 family metallopeptidase [Pyrinomonadaceae bacterium]
MGTSDGQVLGSTKIVDAGPTTERWNVVIVSEGYRSNEMAQFAADAQQFADALLAVAPFNRLRSAINIFRIDVTSADSGAKDPKKCGGGTGAKPRTYFDASFCTNGIRRLLVGNNGRVLKVVSKQVPQWHMAFLAVNSPLSGGSGGAVATFSKAPGAAEIAIHEMGHTAFGLADEYEYYSGCAESGHNKHSGSEPSQPNITTNKNRATTKWRDLIQPSTPVPTTKNANCANCDPQPSPVAVGTIGLFEGADYYHCGVYRPEFDCRMRNLDRPFCGVCQQVIVKKLTPFLPR